MIETENKEEYYEHINYRELLMMQPDNFYLHLPIIIPFTDWLFELRLQLLLMMGLSTNYFGIRHRFEPQAKWFSDWIFLNHYMFDYIGDKSWKPYLTDRIRYQWLMRQGYSKELTNYLDLVDRNKNKKVTVQERKFLTKYEECHYWFYFDSARDDELAFFRMGIDADEPLSDENKPLFPNIAYSYFDAPSLSYFTGSNMRTESIPPNKSWWEKRKAKKAMLKKWENNEKVTYADMRILFNSDTAKIHDLEFLLHCYEKYGGTPKDEAENKLFEELYPLYQTELTHIAQMMHMPELDNLTTSKERKELNPLYIAYKKRWFNKNLVKEFEEVFHGVTQEEYQEIVNKQYELLDKKPRGKSKKNPEDKNAQKRIDDLIVATIKHK